MSPLPWLRQPVDVDWVDFANGFWSVLLLAVCALGAFTLRLTSTLMTCWTPAHFTQAMIDYSTRVCAYSEKLFFFNTSMPETPEPNTKEGFIYSYHLWIPQILFLQAVCFMIPSVVWRLGKRCLAFNMDATVSSLDGIFTACPETRQSTFESAAQLLGHILQKNNCLYALVYLLVKILYCLNLVGQFVFLTVFFKQFIAIKTGTYFGLDVKSHVKPLMYKYVFCQFKAVHYQATQHHLVQCSLPIVDVYEKLFVFLWYWVFFLTIITVFNLIAWVGFLFLPFLRDGRIAVYIRASSVPVNDSGVISRFIATTLGIDGVLLMSMISNNSSELLAARLTEGIFTEVFQKGERPRPVPYTFQPRHEAVGYDPDALGEKALTRRCPQITFQWLP